jgi:hypothetical protein
MENVMITVAECAKKWGISERTVRNYCARQRIPGAVLKGKTWWIPASAERPVRQKKKDALPVLNVLKNLFILVMSSCKIFFKRAEK